MPGAYDPASRMAYIALRSEQEGMTGTLYHEGIHHLRNAGAFSNEDGTPTKAWQTLEREAAKWRKDYKIDERYTGDVAGMGDAQRERLIKEEAIAEALADFATNPANVKASMGARAALNKMLQFFRRMASGLKGRGFDTWESIFEGDIATGKAGKRADAGQPTSKAEMDRYLQAAWHGSPHKFDKFSTEAIGTGEGAQVYGHGLYFAESKDVAKHYKDAMAADSFKIEGQPVSKWAGAAMPVMALHKMRRDLEGGMPFAEAKASALTTMRKMGESEAAGRLEDVAEDDFSMEASLYRVNLAPKEDEYLLWDKPLERAKREGAEKAFSPWMTSTMKSWPKRWLLKEASRTKRGSLNLRKLPLTNTTLSPNRERRASLSYKLT